ncbi:MAG TPA: branched-chain amino acid ABC transporter permease [Bacillota bacterium]|nr:branched-chain amino acid ABC transporter permease [Bacillota bacterium]
MMYFLVAALALGCINAIMVLGFNIQYGFTGILNFTYYTFAAIGAYIAAVTTMGPPPQGVGIQVYILQWSLPWPVGLLLGGLVAAAAGLLVVLIAVRRLRSDYLAIVTVSVGYIIWDVIDNYIPLFNGDNGLFAVPHITGSMRLSSLGYAVVMLIVSALCLGVFYLVARRIYHSPFGRVLRAVREDEVVAASFGKNVFQAQVWVFVIGSFMAGVAGGLLIQYIGAWNPNAFLPLETFVLLAALVIGGTANYNGSILGAFLIIEVVDEASRFLPTFGRPDLVGAVRAIVIGVALILVLRFKPGGLLAESRVRLYGRGEAR